MIRLLACLRINELCAQDCRATAGATVGRRRPASSKRLAGGSSRRCCCSCCRNCPCCCLEWRWRFDASQRGGAADRRDNRAQVLHSHCLKRGAFSADLHLGPRPN